MKAKNKLLTMLILSAGAVAGTTVINKIIKISATSKNLLVQPQSLCYKWRLGNIHYTKIGEGKPLLLIHDLTAASSGYEWNQIIGFLKDEYTVYTIDLLGCGQSEKPNMTYTNYLYVQLISDFILNVIGHRTSVIATGESASIPVMSCANNSELFDQIMLINPLSLVNYSKIAGKSSRFFKFIVDLPVLGTLLYNIACSKQILVKEFATRGFYNPYSVKQAYIDSYYESAHLGASPKSVFSSVQCNYTKCNITNALKKIDNSIYIVGGESVENITQLINEYKTYNSAIESTIITGTKYFISLENPIQLQEYIKTYFG